MINFVLKKPSEIVPWGEENNQLLHWFGLTDSYCWLEFEDAQLLRYSDAFVEFYNLDKNLPYVDYPFARMFGDFTSIVRAVLSPIPDEIFEVIRSFSDFDAYLNSLSNWLEKEWNETDEDFDNLYLPARQWIDHRRLDFGYLVGGPSLYFFRHKDRIYVRWVSDAEDENGISMWESTNGEYVMDVEKFIRDLQLSVNSFALAMNTQIKSVLDHPIEHVFIDKKRLLESHQEFLEEVKSYEGILSFAEDQTGWEEVLSTMKKITN